MQTGTVTSYPRSRTDAGASTAGDGRRSKGTWKQRIAIAVVAALLISQGIGLVYLAIVLRRSTDGIVRSQVALLRRLEQAQQQVSAFAGEQETVRLLIGDQQRRLDDLEARRRQERADLDLARTVLEDRVVSLETELHSMKALHREFGLLLASAQETWVALTRDLVTYREEMRRAVEAVASVRAGEAGETSRRRDGTGPTEVRLPRGVTTSDTGPTDR